MTQQKKDDLQTLLKKSPLTEMPSSLKVAKTHVHVYCFHAKHLICWDLRGMLGTENFAQKDSK